jgi:hypothetical protein
MINAPAGQPVAIAVQPTFGALESVQWLENGVEVPAAANGTAFQCCAQLSGTRTVTVRVRDNTGRIARPPPHAAYFEKTWQVVFH